MFAVTLNDHQPVCTYHGLYWYLLALGILHAVPKILSWGFFLLAHPAWISKAREQKGKKKKKKKF